MSLSSFDIPRNNFKSKKASVFNSTGRENKRQQPAPVLQTSTGVQPATTFTTTAHPPAWTLLWRRPPFPADLAADPPQPPGHKQRPRPGVQDSPSAGPQPGREMGRPLRAIEAGRKTEGRDEAELGRRRLRRGAPAWTGPPRRSPPPPAPLSGGEQSAPSHPHPSGEAQVAGRSTPGPRSPVPGCGARGAGAAPPPCPAPAAGGPDASGSVRPGRHVSRAARCIVGRGGRESLEGGRRCRAAACGAWAWCSPALPHLTLPGAWPAGGGASPAPQNCPSSGQRPPPITAGLQSLPTPQQERGMRA
ncbi:translation initiation factor IF-2-like [Melopsittacus undulatus]|uniref:translation initiation factor IF-2-like n=1 Tax=Melopsittacus undulatus TaxID=13146 RepID=UPI00146CAD1B|nr:translation initiation factor IF-2-like [Melopsittacus undulatus]